MAKNGSIVCSSKNNKGRVPANYAEYSVGYKDFYVNPKISIEMNFANSNNQRYELGYKLLASNLIPGIALVYSYSKNRSLIPIIELSAFRMINTWV